jgi:molybdopterin molybdochelatase
MVQLSSDAFAFEGGLMPVEEALALVAARIPALTETEMVGLVDADGRFLARDVVAPVDLPVFDNSAVDGYAVAHADSLRMGRPSCRSAPGSRLASTHPRRSPEERRPAFSPVRPCRRERIPSSCKRTSWFAPMALSNCRPA